jgi:hypothetical protein
MAARYTAEVENRIRRDAGRAGSSAAGYGGTGN